MNHYYHLIINDFIPAAHFSLLITQRRVYASYGCFQSFGALALAQTPNTSSSRPPPPPTPPSSESVFVFLRDADSGDLSVGIQMAYNCMNNASNSHVFNFMVSKHAPSTNECIQYEVRNAPFPPRKCYKAASDTLAVTVCSDTKRADAGVHKRHVSRTGHPRVFVTPHISSAHGDAFPRAL